MFDIETTEKGRSFWSRALGMMVEASYHTSKGRESFGGRGKGSLGGPGVGRGGGNESENSFRCGESDHWSTHCPKKESICTWRGGTGHVERTSYDKENGTPRGKKLLE